MSIDQPVVLLVAVAVAGALVWGYVVLARERTALLARSGLELSGPARSVTRRAAVRRHLPYALMLAAVVVLLFGLSRPQVTLVVPRISGTVVLAFDVSASMAARDVAPSRLSASQAAARRFVEAQPGSVDIGVVTFGSGALTTQEPSSDHAGALAAIGRLRPGGATSLGQAILASLSAIVGKPVTLPEDVAEPPGDAVAVPDLGYWGSATIVVLSDGENTTGPDAEAAAALAATAGVHVETIGVGTVQGATVDVDGFQVATALDEALLTRVAETANGSYHPARDAAQLDGVYRSLDLRNVAQAQPVEFTGGLVLVAVVLLLLGGLLMIRWHGRLV